MPPATTDVFGRMNRERVLVLAAPAALLLQLAHPLVAAAINDHTDRRRDVLTRLNSTVATNLTVIFGQPVAAQAAAARVRAIHEASIGELRTPVGRFAAGTPYAAADPELLVWAYATIVEMGLRAYDAFVRRVRPGERAAYIAGARSFGAAFGIPTDRIPADVDAFDAYWGAMTGGSDLTIGPEAATLANEILRPRLPFVLRPALPVTALITAGLLPARIRSDYRLPWSGRHATVFEILGRASRAALPFVPGPGRHYRVAPV